MLDHLQRDPTQAHVRPGLAHGPVRSGPGWGSVGRVASVARLLLATTVVPVAMLALGSSAVSAQMGGDGFLFRPPMVTVGVVGGWAMPTTGSDVFDETRRLFTVGDRDFEAPYLGGRLAVRVTERLDAGFEVGTTRRNIDSTYRDFVDQDDREIEQSTRLRTIPVIVTARYYFADRGRRVSQFAWIPSRLVPYVGGGVGAVNYEFVQAGDFVDFDTYEVATDGFISSSTTAMLQAAAGADLTLSPILMLSGEAAYSWARGDLGPDYDGFEAMDLAGLRFTLALSARF